MTGRGSLVFQESRKAGREHTTRRWKKALMLGVLSLLSESIKTLLFHLLRLLTESGWRSRCAASDGADSDATALGGLTGIEINRFNALCPV